MVAGIRVGPMVRFCVEEVGKIAQLALRFLSDIVTGKQIGRAHV